MATGTARPDYLDNGVYFGDGTGGANSRTDLSSVQFHQIPEPSTSALIALFGGGIVFLRRFRPTA